MKIGSFFLYHLARSWPSPMEARARAFAAEPGSHAYEMAYARDQFYVRSRHGIEVEIEGRDVLDVGCGHGGIACYLGVLGARRVVGIDVNTKHLGCAQLLAKEIAFRFHPECQLPVWFTRMTADHLALRDEEFDLVFADNVFEHFTEPAQVLREVARVLRPGGQLYVPTFSSIYSKYGLHLKHGLKLPWANLAFSERTIIETLARLAAENSRLYEIYPGLRESPVRVRDVRRYKDLNEITLSSFRDMAGDAGFRLLWLRPFSTMAGKVLRRIPIFRRSLLVDVFSVGASALLQKK